MPEKADKPEAKPFDKFRELTRKLVSVPKKELDAREAEYQKAKAKRQKRRKSS